MFKKLEGDQALLRHGGVYKPVDLFTFSGGLYAKLGSGYVRLKADGTSSKDGVSLQYLESDIALYKDRFGRLAVTDGPGHKTVELKIEGEKTVLMIEKDST